MHENHPYLDAVLIGAGAFMSVLTSQKTLIFVTVVYTIVRTWVAYRNRDRK